MLKETKVFILSSWKFVIVTIGSAIVQVKIEELDKSNKKH